jgi:hypothetical protein
MIRIDFHLGRLSRDARRDDSESNSFHGRRDKRRCSTLAAGVQTSNASTQFMCFFPRRRSAPSKICLSPALSTSGPACEPPGHRADVGLRCQPPWLSSAGGLPMVHSGSCGQKTLPSRWAQERNSESDPFIVLNAFYCAVGFDNGAIMNQDRQHV